MKQKKVAVIGARGYTGLELCRLLLKHSNFVLSHVTSSDAAWKLSHDLPAISLPKDLKQLTTEGFLTTLPDVDVVILACSAKDSHLFRSSLKKYFVIDMSGAFRLSPQEAKNHYKLDVSASESEERNYGLCPWQENNSLEFVANPGCYPTAVLMALIPLLRESLVEPEHIIIDAKSGVSGAGRNPSELAHFAELSESIIPYKIGKHQHAPEIARFAKYFTKKDLSFQFTTTLLPICRGILASLYLRKAPGVTLEDVRQAYDRSYQNYPLFEFFRIDSSLPANVLSLKSVANTALTRVAAHDSGDELVLFSMIDNLQKGAASQAIENLNRHFSFPLERSLLEGVL